MNNLQDMKYEIFNSVWKKINDIYPLFDERNIDWEYIREIYNEKIHSVNSFEKLYKTLNDMILELKDPHTKIFNYKCESMYNIAPFLLTYTNDKIYIKHILDNKICLMPGCEIKSIDKQEIEILKKSINEKYKFNSLNIRNAYLIKELTKYFSEREIDIEVEYMNRIINTKTNPLNVEKIIKDNINYKIKYCESKVLNKDVLYIKLLSFYDDSIVNEFKNILMQYNNLKKIIIDIRGNSGGLIRVAQGITEYINDKDKLLFYKTYRTKESEYKKFTKHIPVYAHSKQSINFNKLAVLCDENTSSSAECIFLRTLINSNDKIKVFGCKTAGLVHEATVFTLFDNTKLQITSQKYLNKDKTLMEEDGIEPDYIIPYGINDILIDNDLVLNEGIKFCSGY